MVVWLFVGAFAEFVVVLLYQFGLHFCTGLGLLHWLVVLLQGLCFCSGLGCAPLVRPDRRPGGSGVCGQ